MNPNSRQLLVKSSRLFNWWTLGASLLFASSLSAQTVITILNPSFENPTVSDPDFAVPADNWSQTNATASGVFRPATSGATPAAIDGSQVGFANGFGGLQQILGTNFVTGSTYSFSTNIGFRSGTAGPASGSAVLGYWDGSSFHSLLTLNASPATGTFDFVSGSYQATSTENGQAIAIQLLNTDSPQVVFDVVSLSVSAIPEPATIASAIGGVALIAAVWRRKLRPAPAA